MKHTTKLFGIIALVAVMVFLTGCPDGRNSGPQWEPVNVPPVTGTKSGNTINFTYEGSNVTLTKNGGGESLDGVWEGTFEGNTVKVTVSGDSWKMEALDSVKYVDYAKGTVTLSGATMIIVVTHVMGYGSGGGDVDVVGGGEIFTDGRLTITGLEDYNGEFIRAVYNNRDDTLILDAAPFHKEDENKIINGQATSKVYRISSHDVRPGPYSGNDKKLVFRVFIPDQLKGTVTAHFTNGIATGEFMPIGVTEGCLTITGLENHNGKKIRAYSYEGIALYAGGEWEVHDVSSSVIVDGQVTLNVYEYEGTNYIGNDQNVVFTVRCEQYYKDGSITVNFTDGIAAGKFVAPEEWAD